MEIVGRLTKDAIVSKTKSQKEVVNFSVAVNDSYKPKGAAEYMQITTYFNCSYWLSSKAAEALKKGVLVQMTGRVSVNAYTNANGEAKADLRFHVNNFKLLGKGQKERAGNHSENTPVAEIAEDLPF